MSFTVSQRTTLLSTPPQPSSNYPSPHPTTTLQPIRVTPPTPFAPHRTVPPAPASALTSLGRSSSSLSVSLIQEQTAANEVTISVHKEGCWCCFVLYDDDTGCGEVCEQLSSSVSGSCHECDVHSTRLTSRTLLIHSLRWELANLYRQQQQPSRRWKAVSGRRHHLPPARRLLCGAGLTETLCIIASMGDTHAAEWERGCTSLATASWSVVNCEQCITRQRKCS